MGGNGGICVEWMGMVQSDREKVGMVGIGTELVGMVGEVFIDIPCIFFSRALFETIVVVSCR